MAKKTDFEENETLIYKGLDFCKNLTFERSNRHEIGILTWEGYPKMELIEEVQNDLPLGLEPDDLWPEKSKKNSTEAERKQIVEEDEDILPMPPPRTFKKHYRFKNREYIRR